MEFPHRNHGFLTRRCKCGTIIELDQVYCENCVHLMNMAERLFYEGLRKNLKEPLIRRELLCNGQRS